MTTKNSIGFYPIPVEAGGTGQQSLTQNGILVGNSTSPVSSISGAVNGDLLIGATGLPPAFNQVTSSDGSITVTPGVNSVTISAGDFGPSVSWTPVINFSPSRSFSYTSQVGTYVRIGKIVSFTCYISGTASSSGGTSYITGLPGGYNTSVSRYYYPALLTEYTSPNSGPWPQGYSYLDTSTGRIILIQNQPSSNNQLFNEPAPSAIARDYQIIGYDFIY